MHKNITLSELVFAAFHFEAMYCVAVTAWMSAYSELSWSYVKHFSLWDTMTNMIKFLNADEYFIFPFSASTLLVGLQSL